MNVEEQATEYLDCLVSAELSAELARRFGEKENLAVRNCCTALMQRILDRQNYLIFEGLRKQPFPAGALAMMRRQLDSFLTEEGESND